MNASTNNKTGALRDFWVERLLTFLRDQVCQKKFQGFPHKDLQEGVQACGVMGTGWGSWVATRLSSYGEVQPVLSKHPASSLLLSDPCLRQRPPSHQLSSGGGQGGPLRGAGGGELPHHDADMQRQLSQREAWRPCFKRLQVGQQF